MSTIGHLAERTHARCARFLISNMTKIRMKTAYMDYAKQGQVWETDAEKAAELVSLDRAEYVDVETAAPVNKQVQGTSRKLNVCHECGKGYATPRGLKLHTTLKH